MTVTVLVSTKAQRSIDNLPAIVKARVLAKVQALKDYPAVSGIKALKGEWLGHYRVRVGDYRVIFTLASGSITVVAVDDRKEAY